MKNIYMIAIIVFSGLILAVTKKTEALNKTSASPP